MSSKQLLSQRSGRFVTARDSLALLSPIVGDRPVDNPPPTVASVTVRKVPSARRRRHGAKRGTKRKVGKKRGKSTTVFSTYIHRVHQKENPGGMTISKSAMAALNSFVVDQFTNLATAASDMVKIKRTGQLTMSSGDVEAAVRLLLSVDLARLASFEGAKAVRRYKDSRK